MESRGQTSQSRTFLDEALPSYDSCNYNVLTDADKGIHVARQQNILQATVVTITATDVPEKDYLVWSIFNTVYFNFCCLGLWALTFSVKSRDRKQVGARNEASRYSSVARYLNIAATSLSIFFFILWIVLVSTGVMKPSEP